MSTDTPTSIHCFRVTRDEEDLRVWLAEWAEDGRVHTLLIPPIVSFAAAVRASTY